jgi:transmembrane sensor
VSVQGQIDRLIALQAAEWFEVIRSGQKHAHAEFLEWLSESPRHMEAFMAIASEAPAIRAAFRSGRVDRQALLKRVSPRVTQLKPALVREEKTEPLATSTVSLRRRWMVAAIAAGIAVIAIGVGFMVSGWRQFDTPVGEQRIVQLADGSIVNLNARSHLEVRLGKSEREIRLRGEALFKVAHDASRPFRVHTEGAVVQAVGTQFNVYARADGTTTVSVLEGKVQVTADTPAPIIPSLTRLATKTSRAKPLPLIAGEQAAVATTGHIERLAAPDVTTAVAWQQRKLIFKHAALEDMVDEFNRYNAVQLHLEGVERGIFRFTGAFDADDPQSLALLLSKEPELLVERHEGEIRIRGREAIQPSQ